MRVAANVVRYLALSLILFCSASILTFQSRLLCSRTHKSSPGGKGTKAKMSIKHRLRHEIVEDLQSVRIEDAVGIEVDHTGMELHERCARVSGQLVWLSLAFCYG